MTTSKKSAKRREMWIRRVVSTTILLAILALLVFLVVKGVGMVGSMMAARQQSGDAPVTSQPTAVAISPCTVDNLQFTATSTPTTPTVGGGLALDLSVENKSAKECSLELPTMDVRLSTGDYTVWTPSQCSDSWNGTLLMIPGTPWSTGFQWDGKIYDSCTLLTDDAGTGLVADPGTYHVQIAVNGKWSDSTLTLEIQ